MSKNDGGQAMTIDLESLRGHTPGPWEWWTSCSFRRLSAQGDGDVLCAVTQSDGHPDVHIENGGWEGPDGRLIEIAPTLLAEYERLLTELTARRARDAEAGALVAAARLAISYLSEMNGKVPLDVWKENYPPMKALGDALLPFQRSDDNTGATP